MQPAAHSSSPQQQQQQRKLTSDLTRLEKKINSPHSSIHPFHLIHSIPAWNGLTGAVDDRRACCNPHRGKSALCSSGTADAQFDSLQQSVVYGNSGAASSSGSGKFWLSRLRTCSRGTPDGGREEGNSANWTSGCGVCGLRACRDDGEAELLLRSERQMRYDATLSGRTCSAARHWPPPAGTSLPASPPPSPAQIFSLPCETVRPSRNLRA